MDPAVPNFSVILCTFERTADLLATLASIRHTQVPEGLTGELLVVDSSRSDETRRALAGLAPIPGLPLRVLHEPRRGKAHALNTGIAAARGEVLLFTDDDVRVPADWIGPMVRPILADEADAVAGGIHLAPELCRPWMEPLHRAWMAATEGLDPARPAALIGANMAFGRRVLARVPVFDPELGSGTDLGGCDESLFSFQLREAGFRLVSAFDASVEHHFHSDRLTRAGFLERARIEGRSAAYIDHHWEHLPNNASYLRWLYLSLRLRWQRLLAPAPPPAAEGAPLWEIRRLMRLHFVRQTLRERRRPPNYTRLGFVKIDHARSYENRRLA